MSKSLVVVVQEFKQGQNKMFAKTYIDFRAISLVNRLYNCMIEIMSSQFLVGMTRKDTIFRLYPHL